MDICQRLQMIRLRTRLLCNLSDLVHNRIFLNNPVIFLFESKNFIISDDETKDWMNSCHCFLYLFVMCFAMIVVWWSQKSEFQARWRTRSIRQRKNLCWSPDVTVPQSRKTRKNQYGQFIQQINNLVYSKQPLVANNAVAGNKFTKKSRFNHESGSAKSCLSFSKITYIGWSCFNIRSFLDSSLKPQSESNVDSASSTSHCSVFL